MIDVSLEDDSAFPRGSLLLVCHPSATESSELATSCAQLTLPADVDGQGSLPLDFTAFNEEFDLMDTRTVSCSGPDGCLVYAIVVGEDLSSVGKILGAAHLFLSRS